MPQFDIEQYIRDVIDEHIDITQLANDVSQEINISSEIIQAEIDEYLDERRVTELVDVDTIADSILNNNLSAIEEGLDYDNIADNVYERISISDIADEVMGNHLGDIVDSLDYHDIAENVESVIDYDLIVEKIIKNENFLKAIGKVDAVTSNSTENVIEEKNFIMGPYDGLEDPKKAQVFMNFTKDQLKDVIIASIVGTMTQTEGTVLYTKPADELYGKVFSALPYEVKEFLNRKDR